MKEGDIMNDNTSGISDGLIIVGEAKPIND